MISQLIKNNILKSITKISVNFFHYLVRLKETDYRSTKVTHQGALWQNSRVLDII